MQTDPHLLKRRRTVAVVSLIAVAALFGWLTWLFSDWFLTFKNDPQAFKAFIDSYGWEGRFIALGIQILQVFISDRKSVV